MTRLKTTKAMIEKMRGPRRDEPREGVLMRLLWWAGLVASGLVIVQAGRVRLADDIEAARLRFQEIASFEAPPR
jgi:hypothetical protein